jgi:predicted DNA-binding protein (MmcQ/YjbR family)
MVSVDTFRKLALEFDEAVEQPHFEKPSFRVNKKLFATLDQKNETVTLKLSEIDQSVFCSFDKSIIYPVSGIWGKQGWTIVELKKVRKEMFQDALTVSYCNVAPKRLSEKYKKE